ncbi:glycosyltransferase [Paenibacillus sp. YPG26]|uniref:glycosyltransferase n=1 Tax=Paenibacillus sp. YPG26 TaxID=2878915 RepID=UPI00203B156C|nr:glycosyltransferase [Paenibacillus sp. YPG26]USB33025.1 glycosyltransferase [Paenibacillus sp. YPG26]
MKRVLYLITGFDYAGAESQLVHMCRSLRSKGYEIWLISMVRPVAYLDELAEMGVEVHTLNMRKGIPDPRAIFRLRRLIRSFKPDVIHSHMVHANLLARVTRLFVPMRLLICTAHSMNEGGWLRNLLYRITDPLCDLMTNVSREAVDRYIEIKAAPRRKIILMPNGINLEHFSRSVQDRIQLRDEMKLADRFIWLALGRLVPEKDYETMLLAFARVLEVYPESRLLIAGIGPERSRLEELCRKLKLGEAVWFLGMRTDAARLMSAADGYLMSSRWEGLPMVLLEASASGLPIAATDVGGNKEVVHEGVNGHLAGASDPDHLAACMIKIMANPEEIRSEMGHAGREYVHAEFNINTIVERWENLYGQKSIGHESGKAYSSS